MIENRFNPWHHVSAGNNLPDFVNGIIEIPKGTRAKYELDKDSGLLKLDRVLYSSVYYPANYGFIPQTYCEDHDPLDILILSQIDIVPLCIVPAKVIGVMRMLDNGEADDKIIAVAAGDPGTEPDRRRNSETPKEAPHISLHVGSVPRAPASARTVTPRIILLAG